MFPASLIAKYFLALSDEDQAGDTISNLKLQKLLYYAQGYHLAVFDTPLFPENIFAWDHGPVVTEVYHEYKSYGAKALPSVSDINFDDLNSVTKEFLDEVYTVAGQFSAWKLRNMTHEEPPWNETQRGCKISLESLKSYFDGLVKNG